MTRALPPSTRPPTPRPPTPRDEVPRVESRVLRTGDAHHEFAGRVIEFDLDAERAESRVAKTRLRTLVSCARASGTRFLEVWRLVKSAQHRPATPNDDVRRLERPLVHVGAPR